MNKPLNEFANVEYGKSPSLVLETDSVIPVIGTGGIYGRATRAMYDGPAVVVPRKGSLGNPQYVGQPFWPADTTYAVIPKDGVNAKWLYYNLAAYDLTKLNEATGVPSISRDWLYKIPIYFVDGGLQDRIAEILSAMDEAISKTEVLIEKYKKIKTGLMHDMFTRGVTPEGKLRPTRAQAPTIYKKSYLGFIPEEWNFFSIREIAVKVQDGTHFSPRSEHGPYRYLTSKNVRFGFMDIRHCGWISKEEHESIYKRCDVQFGDVLLTKDGANTGNACLNELNEEFSLLSSVAFIRTDGLNYHGDYLLHYLLSPSGQQRLKDLMTGNAITRLTLEKINNFHIPFPGGKEQRRIADQLNALQIKIHSEENYLLKCTGIKNGLMNDLLTGRVPVKVPEPASA